MQVTIKRLPKSEVEIEGELESQIFEDYFAKALKKIGASLELNGFRRGKAPDGVLLSRIPEMHILEEMAELALTEHYPKITEREKIDAIGRPEISVTKLARKNPLGFKIRTAVLPEVKLPDYKNIARRITSEITPPERNGKTEKENTENARKEKTRLKIIEKIIEESEIDVPEILVELELDKILYQMESDIAQMGLKLEDYLKRLNKTKEDLRSEFRINGEKKAKLGLILNEISKVEKIVADSKQVDEEVAKILERHKDLPAGRQALDPERVRAHAENIFTNELIFQFLESQ